MKLAQDINRAESTFCFVSQVRTSGLALAYYSIDSIIGDEIIGEIFLSVLLQIGTMNFRLDLRNTRFLDDSWKLPDYSILELVPCKTLGITVR